MGAGTCVYVRTHINVEYINPHTRRIHDDDALPSTNTCTIYVERIYINIYIFKHLQNCLPRQMKTQPNLDL